MLKSLKSKPVQKPEDKSEILSDADLDHVSGGLNPQPLPPRWLFSSFRIQALVLPKLFVSR
ncbi:hypothetical protein [Methylobacterium isbiliense]|jgi:hypothetical protein|uniref:Uncharacterized protein n=1 Tax=Methylobacterium isbiliense TaxID=315478 RepID=A0ABQ4SIZ0_9HYPH|nr:hypothetical protein [Methylobacterium isbiliense]MDN3622895.1 hypothetical protein [Methylobacterium isbiliense]GJE02398.1 hypothetical protein GMJLKIPL_4346 [Methylobacterium isbiliense]